MAEAWAAQEACVVCGGVDFGVGAFGPRTLVTCDCCLDRSIHVECSERNGAPLTQEQLDSPAFQWFCSEGCKRVNARLVELTGMQRPLAGAARDGEYSIELVRWSQRDKREQTKVDQGCKVLTDAFSPLIMGNGRNLIDMVCEAFESADGPADGQGQQQGAGGPSAGGGGGGGGDEEMEEEEEEAFNFSTFRVLLLRQKGHVVSAATVRVFGTHFCEIPFIATKDGYRRDGNCRRLIQELECMLHGMGVRHVIVPAMRPVLRMWTRHFGYSEFTQEEVEVLEQRIVMPDPSSAVLVYKKVANPLAPAEPARKKKAPAANTTKTGRGVRFSGIDVSYREASSDSEDERAGRRGGRRGGRARKASDEEEDYQASDEEEEEEEDDEEGVVVEEKEVAPETGPCEHCGELESERWAVSDITGELLCCACKTKEEDDVLGDAGPSTSVAAGRALAASGAGGGRQAAAAGEKVCSNCGAARASKSKTTGLVECRACSGWRASHGGEPRPEKQWAKSGARKPAAAAAGSAAAAGGAPGGGQAGPSAAAAAGAARRGRAGPATPAQAGSAGAAAAANPQTLRERRRGSQGERAADRLAFELGQQRRQAGRKAGLFRATAGAHSVLVEQGMADRLGGHLLHLVESTGGESAQLQHQFEQRAIEDRAALQAAQAAAAEADARAQQAEARCQQLQAAIMHKDSLLAAAAAAMQEQGQRYQGEWQGAERYRLQLERQLAAEAAEKVQLAAELAEQQREGAEKDARLAEMEREVERLRAELAGRAQRAEQRQQKQPAGLAPAGAVPAGCLPGEPAAAGLAEEGGQARPGSGGGGGGGQQGGGGAEPEDATADVQEGPLEASLGWTDAPTEEEREAAEQEEGGAAEAATAVTAAMEAAAAPLPSAGTAPVAGTSGSRPQPSPAEGSQSAGGPAAQDLALPSQPASAGLAPGASPKPSPGPSPSPGPAFGGSTGGPSPAPQAAPAPAPAAPAPGLSHSSAHAGGAGGRRRLTTGRSSGGARHRVPRSRPVPADAAAAADEGAEPAPPGVTAGTAGTLGAAGAAGRRLSEEWGAGLFGMLGDARGSGGSGFGSVAGGNTPDGPAGSCSQGDGGSPGSERQPGPSESPAGASAADSTEAGAAGGRLGPRAGLLRALGSQQSCSQGGAAGGAAPSGRQPLQPRQQGTGRAAGSRAGCAAGPEAAAAAPELQHHLAALSLDELLAAPIVGAAGTAGGTAAATAGAAAAATTAGAAAQAGSPPPGPADQEDAMRAVEDFASYLAD